MVYQAKATTHLCVLVRMVGLELICEYPSVNHLLFPIIKHKLKATIIYEYFTPYACLLSSPARHLAKRKATVSKILRTLYFTHVTVCCEYTTLVQDNQLPRAPHLTLNPYHLYGDFPCYTLFYNTYPLTNPLVV